MLSRKLGEKDDEGVSKAACQGFLLIGAVYLICLAFGLFGVRTFYSIQTDDAEIIELGMQYTGIVTICSFGLMVQSIVERLFSATDEMIAIGVPAFRIIGITAIISGMTIMMSGVFQAMNNSNKALIVSIVQAVSLVGSAAILAVTKSTSIVWFSFPISEIVIFIMSLVFLRTIYSKYLGSEEETEQIRKNMLKSKVIADTM